ncbi:hypothetical protein ACRRTK_017594 [Alexandromys fortis]
MMSFTKFLDIAQENNETISGVDSWQFRKATAGMQLLGVEQAEPLVGQQDPGAQHLRPWPRHVFTVLCTAIATGNGHFVEDAVEPNHPKHPGHTANVYQVAGTNSSRMCPLEPQAGGNKDLAGLLKGSVGMGGQKKQLSLKSFYSRFFGFLTNASRRSPGKCSPSVRAASTQALLDLEQKSNIVPLQCGSGLLMLIQEIDCKDLSVSVACTLEAVQGVDKTV